MAHDILAQLFVSVLSPPGFFGSISLHSNGLVITVQANSVAVAPTHHTPHDRLRHQRVRYRTENKHRESICEYFVEKLLKLLVTECPLPGPGQKSSR